MSFDRVHRGDRRHNHCFAMFSHAPRALVALCAFALLFSGAHAEIDPADRICSDGSACGPSQVWVYSPCYLPSGSPDADVACEDVCVSGTCIDDVCKTGNAVDEVDAVDAVDAVEVVEVNGGADVGTPSTGTPPIPSSGGKAATFGALVGGIATSVGLGLLGGA